MNTLIKFLLFIFFISLPLNGSDKLEKVSLQLLWKHQFEFAGFYIAKEKGYYKDLGLDVQLKEFEFGTNITNDVLSGKSDFGIGRSSLILDKLRDKDIVLLGALYQSTPYVLMTKKRSDIQSIKDFKDKKIMLTDNLESLVAINSMMRSQGINQDDYTKVAHTFNAQDILNGKADIMTVFLSNEPFTLYNMGQDYKIFDPKDYGFDFYSDIIFSSKKFALQSPSKVDRFYKATLKGWKYAFKNIDETVELILKKYNTQNKTKDAYVFEANILKTLAYKQDVEFGHLDELRIKEIANLYKLLGMTKKSNEHLKDLIYKNKFDDARFSQTELNYLKKHPVIKMCSNPNWEPIEFLNTSTKFPDGIAIDTMKLLEKSLKKSIKFEYVPTSSWTQSQQYLKEKKCDILPAAIKTKKREKYANFTQSYLQYPLAIITKNDKPFVNNIEQIINKTISRKKDSGLISKLKSKYPNIDILETKDYLESIQMVSKGEAYCTIATLPVASYYINKFAINNLHIAGYTKMSYDLSIAVRDDMPILLSILDKTLSKLTSYEKKQIYDKWATVKLSQKFDYSLIWKIVIVILILILVVVYWNYKLKSLVVQKTKELEELNLELEQKVQSQVEELRNKELALMEQSKMAQMGEMIANIAHQWRQPLSTISVSSSSMKLQKLTENLSDDDFYKHVDMITNTTQFLSETINNFRDFLKDNKEKFTFDLQEHIDKTLNIVSSTLSNNNIKLLKEYSDCKINIHSIPGEITQVILNIINNAKDVLLEKDIDDKWIKITAKKQDDKAVLIIEDNGGGIPNDIINKIFDPYFTTKHKSQGTGLGLHMSYKIITSSLDGKIYVKNSDNGAQFFIELTLKEE
jgi:signal transduction histidine kinase/ABC-type nitrate/sulfonate/bicarbonate transport system substrate-binding protein